MVRLNVSIVLYQNQPSMVQKAISSVLSALLPIRLILIDNSPTDELKALTSLDKRIEYIHNPANPGYGAAHNIAIAQSIQEENSYHLVLNPDIYFDLGVLEEIVAYMDHHTDVGLLMPRVLYPDGTIQYLAKLLPTPVDLILRRFLPFTKWKEKRNYIYELRLSGYDKIMNVPYLSGCFMFLRVSALVEVGMFDERFFMYPEDIDLTRRVHQKYKTIYYPHVHIVHEHGKDSFKNFKMLRIHMWNIIKYFNKWGWFVDHDREQINAKILKEVSAKS